MFTKLLNRYKKNLDDCRDLKRITESAIQTIIGFYSKDKDDPSPFEDDVEWSAALLQPNRLHRFNKRLVNSSMVSYFYDNANNIIRDRCDMMLDKKFSEKDFSTIRNLSENLVIWLSDKLVNQGYIKYSELKDAITNIKESETSIISRHKTLNRYRKILLTETLNDYTGSICYSMVEMWLRSHALIPEKKCPYLYDDIDICNLVDIINGKLPPSEEIYEHLTADIDIYIDSALANCIEHHRGIYDESKINRDEISRGIIKYMKWLSDELSKTGFVSSNSIYNKLSYLGFYIEDKQGKLDAQT